jgi:hypothetical protein
MGHLASCCDCEDEYEFNRRTSKGIVGFDDGDGGGGLYDIQIQINITQEWQFRFSKEVFRSSAIQTLRAGGCRLRLGIEI